MTFPINVCPLSSGCPTNNVIRIITNAVDSVHNAVILCSGAIFKHHQLHITAQFAAATPVGGGRKLSSEELASIRISVGKTSSDAVGAGSTGGIPPVVKPASMRVDTADEDDLWTSTSFSVPHTTAEMIGALLLWVIPHSGKLRNSIFHEVISLS